MAAYVRTDRERSRSEAQTAGRHGAARNGAQGSGEDVFGTGSDRRRYWHRAPGAAVMPFKNYLAGAPGDRFYWSQRENLRPSSREFSPVDRPRGRRGRKALQARDRASRPRAGRTRSRDRLASRPYHRPDMGAAFRIDYRPAHDSGGRDPKIIHELNRQQHLPRLAKAYLLTGDERYASEAVAQLNSWIDQNPPGRGINWQSSLEIGIRTISWLWTIFPPPFPVIRRGFGPAHRRLTLRSTRTCIPVHVPLQ